MSVYQCKMCGGALEVSPGMTVCRCGFCGSAQSLPRLGVDKRAGLLERAEQYRHANEYDKAMSLFEQLLADDSSDADIYWSIALCRYGIEYVEDPLEHRRIPTVNRTHFRSILLDDDYKSALRYADSKQLEIFTAHAAEIDELQKRILETSQAEEPFDIFLCYKETDSKGKRTADSVLADGLYHQLSSKGYRVFFSRVTLEDKIGTEYEPYIFAALNSAKVMIVLGTKAEHLSAVWVRNEWSRYLALAANDTQKTLIAVYRDITKEELPEEFLYLQSFDMSAQGFEQELLRGIAKLIPEGRKNEQATVISAAPASADSLIRRAYLFLEENNFERADELGERALDLEPENAEAYLVKLLAEHYVRTADELGGLRVDLSMSGNYDKAVRFGDEAMRGRLENYRKQALYNKCLYEFNAAVNESQFTAIGERFRALSFSDSENMAAECERKAAELREAERENRYARAAAVLENSVIMTELQSAKTDFKSLGEYRQSEELARRCEERIEALQAEKEKKRLDKMLRENMLRLRQKKLDRRVRIAGIAGAAVIVATVFGGIIMTNAAQSGKYEQAMELRENNDFDGAKALFIELGDYSDAYRQINQTTYLQALYLKECGDYSAALSLFSGLGKYADSEEQIRQVKYLAAGETFDKGDYASAALQYMALGSYSDSKERYRLSRYNNALSLNESGDYMEAVRIFEELGSYSDSAAQANKIRYANAMRLKSEGSFEEAVALFKELGSYSDAKKQISITKYEQAVYVSESGDLLKAAELFDELGNYSDAKERAQKNRYDVAAEAISSGNYEKGISLYVQLNGYLDSSELLLAARHEYIDILEEAGRYQEAHDVLITLRYTENVTDRARELQYKNAVSMIDRGDYAQAIPILEGMREYPGAYDQIRRAKYAKATELRDSHMFDEAIKIFKELGPYSDAHSQIAVTEQMRKKYAQAGDTVYFGGYEQNVLGRRLDMEWLVLERRGTKALLLSKKIIELKPFGAETWAESPLRTWLNNDFISIAFTEEELAKLYYTDISTPDNETYGTYGGAGTYDRVFLLSEEEVCQYMDTNRQRSAIITNTCEKDIEKIINADYSGDTYSGMYMGWWLRSPGGKFGVQCVNKNGFIDDTGKKYDYQLGGVRPAIWVDLGE